MTLVLIRKVGGLKFRKTFTGSKNPPDSRMDVLKSHPRCERIGSGLSLESLDGKKTYILTYIDTHMIIYGYEFLLGIKRATPGPSCLIPIKRDPLFNRY